jgi:hypothetical protein
MLARFAEEGEWPANTAPKRLALQQLTDVLKLT